MTRKLPGLILIVAVMLMAIACLLVPLSALATEREHKPTQRHPVHSTSSAATGPVDVSLMNMPGDVLMRGGNSYSLVSSAPSLPGGLCPKNRTIQVLLLFTFSEVGTEHECLDKVLSYMREAIPKPAVTNYISNYAAPAAPVVAECPKPKAAKLAKKPKRHCD